MNTLRLKPCHDESQRLLDYQVEISPAARLENQRDLWGNTIENFYIADLHSALEIKATSIVRIQKSPLVEQLHYSAQMQTIFISPSFYEGYLPYLSQTSFTFLEQAQIDSVLKEIGPCIDPIKFALAAMRYFYASFTYKAGITTVQTKATEAFALTQGVCQDKAHMMIGLLRSQGIPARYVSGYLFTGKDASLLGDEASHAWVEFIVPGIGWIGLDPTNQVEALNQHIRVSAGRDYADVSPVEGVYRGGKQSLRVEVSVELIDEAKS